MANWSNPPLEASATCIVAIAGSAGSFAPLKRILGLQSPSSSVVFVILIHRTAEPPFHLDSILQRACALPVAYAKHDERLRPGHVYIAPPGEAHLVIQDGCSRLVPGERASFHRPAADPLFKSIAACNCRKIGVVLSGVGHNGVEGLAAIKATGGQVLVQAPSEAEFAEMPQNALAAVTPDLCAPAAELGEWLVRNTSEGWSLESD